MNSPASPATPAITGTDSLPKPTGKRHAKGIRATTRNVLTYKEQRIVDAWVKENYVKDGLDDTKSAAKATQELGLSVSFSHIKFFREVNDLPSNYGQGRKVAADAAATAAITNEIALLRVILASHKEAIEALQRDLAAFKLAMKYNSGPVSVGAKLQKVEG